MTVKTTSQILDEAADILAAENAWTKGHWHQQCEAAPGGISSCADGALERASGLVTNIRIEQDDAGSYVTWDRADADEYGDPTNEGPVYAAYLAAFHAANQYALALPPVDIPGHHRGVDLGIVGRNDHDDTTQDDIVGILRGAADQQRAREAATPAA